MLFIREITTLIKTAKIKKTDYTKCCQGCGRMQVSNSTGGNVK